MSEGLLRWGLLSTAHINRALIPVLRASKRNRLVAVASRTQGGADDYARQWKIPVAFGSYEALLADPEIDVVYNSLPNHLHAEWTIKAVQAGKHVLCEKPLALSLKEVDAMAAAAKEHGVVLAEAFMYRHHPQTLKVKELVESGVLGKLQLIRGSFTFMLTYQENYRFDHDRGGGSLWDVGCYPISYARMIVGEEPLEVFGWQVTGAAPRNPQRGSKSKGPGGVDLTFIGQVRFPGGIFFQFDSGFQSPLHAFVEIVGAEATLNVPVPFKPGRAEKIYLTRQGKTETIRVRGQDLYSGEVEDMADAVLLGKPPRLSLIESRANVAAILALLESARKGKPVSL